MRLIGLDPGLRLTGWGVIDVEGNRLRHVAHGAEVLLGAVNLVRALVALAAHHVVGAGVDRLLHHLVGRADLERKAELAHAVEHEGDRVGLA